MSDIFKPLLAGKFDPQLIKFPVLASPKIDGIRCLAMNGRPMSRSQKVLPNMALQGVFSRHARELEGLDGELIVGPATATDVYRNTCSHVMSEDKVFGFTYHVFDLTYYNVIPFLDRLEHLRYKTIPYFVRFVNHVMLHTLDDMDVYETECLEKGYEGIMIRDPDGPYKQGRSSTKEGILLKVKRYDDAEAEIIGVEEEMHNTNEAERNELGRTKRSTMQAGLVGKGTMGALVVRGINGPFAGVEFNIGTGFTASQRADTWPLGTIVTYKSFNVGAKDKPRHPVFKGIRNPLDMVTTIAA